MTRSKEEIKRLLAHADKAQKEAPKMAPEDARRLIEKWHIDSASYTPDMVKRPDEIED